MVTKMWISVNLFMSRFIIVGAFDEMWYMFLWVPDGKTGCGITSGCVGYI